MDGLKNLILSRPKEWRDYFFRHWTSRYQLLVDDVWFGEVAAGESLNLQIPAAAKRLVIRLATCDQRQLQSRVFELAASAGAQVKLQARHHPDGALWWLVLPYIGPLMCAGILNRQSYWRSHLRIVEIPR